MSGGLRPQSDAVVDVVIVSFESSQELARALESVRRQARPTTRTIVVDNASRDGSATAAREASPGALVLENAANVGFAAACNRGWRAGRAPLVLFLNPDTELADGAVAAMAGLFADHPDVGVVGPRTTNDDGSVQASTGPDLTPAGERRQRRLVRGVSRRDGAVLAEVERLHSLEHDVDWVSGACLMARRACLEAVGGFDDGFFLYEEDADLCRRVRAAGWRVLFTPRATVVHALGRSMARDARRARLEYQRSHLRYYRKHNGPLVLAGLRAWLALRGGAAWLGALARRDGAAAANARALAALALRGRGP